MTKLPILPMRSSKIILSSTATNASALLSCSPFWQTTMLCSAVITMISSISAYR
jgi:hypothetical protein